MNMKNNIKKSFLEVTSSVSPSQLLTAEVFFIFCLKKEWTNFNCFNWFWFTESTKTSPIFI